jgi:transposase
MLKPGLGPTHRAYLWSYSSSEYDTLQAVIYDFAEGRSGHYAPAGSNRLGLELRAI